MQTFQNTVTIARPVGEVFAFLADLRNIPRWNYAIARTVPTSPGPAGAGATYRQTRTIPAAAGRVSRSPSSSRPPASPSQGQPGPFRATASYLLEPVPSGTRLATEVELEPIPALLRPIGPHRRSPVQLGGRRIRTPAPWAPGRGLRGERVSAGVILVPASAGRTFMAERLP